MGRLNNLAYPLVTISIDFGGSGTKVIVQIRSGKPKAIWMEPGVIKANYESLVFQTRNLNNAYPENAAWVGIGEDYRAIGSAGKKCLWCNTKIKTS